jgi:hypothetical protein
MEVSLASHGSFVGNDQRRTSASKTSETRNARDGIKQKGKIAKFFNKARHKYGQTSLRYQFAARL